MTQRKKLDENWVEVKTTADVLLTDGPFNLLITTTAPTKFDPKEPGHLINHALMLPQDTPAYVCNPRGGYVTGSVMDGSDAF